jgi:hypothetical protein
MQPQKSAAREERAPCLDIDAGPAGIGIIGDWFELAAGDVKALGRRKFM